MRKRHPWNRRPLRRALKYMRQDVGPIDLPVVRRCGDGYELVDGHPRYEILRELGVTNIPCLVLKETQPS